MLNGNEFSIFRPYLRYKNTRVVRLVCGSVDQIHDLYRLPTGCSKLAHHAVCAVRPIIVCLMNCCHATLAIILLCPFVSAIVHRLEIVYFLKFLTLQNSS